MPGLLACGNGGAVKLRESLRKVTEAVGERVSLHHLGADAEQYALGARVVVLLRHRKQHFLERQPGL